MQAYFFGGAQRQLLACFEPAQGDAAKPTLPAVLLIGPHGQEGLRAHRLLRVLAQRLARQGHDVLRFDAYGSGDSAGDDEALDLTSWCDDVQLAASELQERSSASAQVWIAWRLGAVAALNAIDRVPTTPRALALIEPIDDGMAYLGHLAVATVELLEASMSIKDPSWRESLQRDPHAWQKEALGFTLGERLIQQLCDLKPSNFRIPAGVPTQVIVPSPALRSLLLSRPWASAAGGRLEVLASDYAFDWTAEEALNSALVPPHLLGALVGWAQHFRSGEHGP